MLTRPTFDTNGNRVLSLDDGYSSGIEIGFAMGGVTSIRNSSIGATSDFAVYSRADGTANNAAESHGVNFRRNKKNLLIQKIQYFLFLYSKINC